MAVRPTKLGLTRDQFASFLQDFEQIKQFENLFATVDTINNVTLDDINIVAGNANATANEANDSIQRLLDALDRQPSDQSPELLAAINELRQELQTMPRNELGTMAPLQQDNIPWLRFDNTPQGYPTGSSTNGTIYWNDSDQTINIAMEYDVIQQVGEEQYARVRNNTGSTIPNGSVVYFTGTVPDNALSVAPYIANGTINQLYTVGIMTHDLPDTGQKGYCTTFGFVRGLDTSAFSVTDVIYASPTTAGAFTKVKPTAPNNVIPLGVVITVSATDGVIFVRPTIEQELYYGEFTKTDTQTPAAANTAYALTFTNTELAQGVSRGTPTSRIVVANTGLYNFNTSVQITSTNSSQKSIWVWLRKNGTTDVPNSARIASITLNNGYLVVSLNEVISVLAGEYYEVMYATDNTNVSIATVAATAFAPAAPAVILAVTQTEQ